MNQLPAAFPGPTRHNGFDQLRRDNDNPKHRKGGLAAPSLVNEP